MPETKSRAWAERHRLRKSQRWHVCPCQLIGGRTSPDCPDGGGWLDHVSLWNRDGKPAVFVSQPYGVTTRGLSVLLDWARAHDVHVNINSWSFYGHGSTQIELWAPGVEPGCQPDWRASA